MNMRYRPSIGGWIALLYGTIVVGSEILPIIFHEITALTVVMSYALGFVIMFALVMVLTHSRFMGSGRTDENRPSLDR